jgi:hypothetical protein
MTSKRETLAIVVMMCAALLACSKGKSSGSGGTEASKPGAAKAPAQQVAVKTLLDEYKGNEVKADTLYKGKRLQITGKVGDIKKDITDSIYVTIGTGARFEIPSAQCFFDDKDTAKAAGLTKGESITVECDCSGLMMNVLMKNCEFK